MRSLICAGALSLLLSATAAPAALAQDAPPAAGAMFRATTLSLADSGEVKVAPDMATIALAVSNQAPAAAEAMQQNAQQMSRVIAALRAAGVEARDIRTSQLSVNPQYIYKPNETPQLSGYQAVNQVSITVRDLKRLGQTVDASVSAGANSVNGISFGLVDPTAAEDAARLAAVKALLAKADLYARATGYRVVRLVNLSEGEAQRVRPPLPMATAAMRASAETPVSPGETTVRIEVSGLFELGR